MKIIKYGGNALKSERDRKIIYKQIKVEKNKNEKIVLIVSAFKDGPYSTNELSHLLHKSYTPLMKQQIIILGEIISSLIVTNELLNEGIDATLLYPYETGIYVNFIDKMESVLSLDNETLLKCVDNHQVVVIPGFIGINQDDYLVSLNEGGSDLTAILVAKMLSTDEVYLKKDVLGLASIDPSLTNKYKLYEQVSYDYAMLLVRHGNKLIQQDALSYAKEYQIKVHISHYLNSSYESTICKNSKDRAIVFSLYDNALYIDGYSNAIFIENYLSENKIKYDCIMNLKSSLKITTSHKNLNDLLFVLHNLLIRGELS